ncbi:MAG: TolC family protein [Gammaproteobacteria bacterium]|nr:TolC family protein [Gammaproteobacteria bacterium]
MQQVLQQLVDNYPSLQAAHLQVQRAQQENSRVESQLGWQLSSQAGFSHDTSLFGTPTDRFDVGGGLNRQLASGASLGINASIVREDADTAFSPSMANPATSTTLDVKYRQPLQQGSDNPAHTAAIQNAAATESIAHADRQALYDQLASQLIEVYLGAVNTQVRLRNIENTIQRNKRLKKYINQRYSLGVSEDKDVLQVQAQLSSAEAEKQGLDTLWHKQKISLNRLMGRMWNAEFMPVLPEIAKADHAFQKLLQEIKSVNANVKRIQARLQLADSAIQLRRDARQDKLDLVLYAGNKSLSGDTATGSLNDSELVGGVRLEFSRGLDKSGFDAALKQAQLDRGMALEDQRQVLQDLEYSLASLLAEIETSQLAVKAYKKSVSAEQKKLAEAEKRYSAGRAETDQLLQFEAQLSASELALAFQQIELARRHLNLAVLTGDIWKNIHKPDDPVLDTIKMGQGE